jgi:hypothetical protein
MWRVVVCDQENSKKKNEETKDRYWAVKIQPQWVVTPGKQPNIDMIYLLTAIGLTADGSSTIRIYTPTTEQHN